MYVSPISALFPGGKSTPAKRAIYLVLSLSLFVIRVDANDAHHTFAVDHLALVANFLDRRSYLHKTPGWTASLPHLMAPVMRACAKSCHASDREATTPPRPYRPEPTGRNSFLPRPPDGPKPFAALPTPPSRWRWAALRPPWPPPCGPRLRPRQHPRSVLRHRDAMLEMSRIRAVLRDRRPLVFQHDGLSLPGVDHGLYRQNHAFLQARIVIFAIHVVRNLRLLVELGADTVTHILPDNRKSVSPDMLFHRTAHVK